MDLEEFILILCQGEVIDFIQLSSRFYSLDADCIDIWYMKKETLLISLAQLMTTFAVVWNADCGRTERFFNRCYAWSIVKASFFCRMQNL